MITYPTPGWVSARFESNGSPATIANNPDDPGGKSYGSFQLAEKTGTLLKYLDYTSFQELKTCYVLDKANFDKMWIKIAKEHTSLFEQEQNAFIIRTHYNPVRTYASKRGILEQSEAIREFLISASVQHSYNGNRKIIDDATIQLIVNPRELYWIEMLYNARANYVQNLKLTKALKTSILNRYKKEKELIVAAYNLN